jgi:uncharacterized membrane protein YdfJ with MMPL/SSD domain
MIIAIVVDATVVRTLLVPATMRLMGDANCGPRVRCVGCTPDTESVRMTRIR